MRRAFIFREGGREGKWAQGGGGRIDPSIVDLGECEERGEEAKGPWALQGSRGDQTGRLPHVDSGAHLWTPPLHRDTLHEVY